MSDNLAQDKNNEAAADSNLNEAQSASEEQSLSLKENIKILFGSSRAFWMVNMINVGDGIAYFAILNLLTLFIGMEVGFSDTGKTIAVSVFTGMVTLFMFGGGFVSDKLGVRRALSFSVLFLLLGRIMLVSSPLPGGMMTDIILWGSLLFMGFGSGVLQPALYAGVKEFTDPRTTTIGYSLLYSLMNLGIILGSAASPFIREKSGISGVFIIMAVITGLMLLFNMLFFTKKLEQRERVVPAEAPKPKEDEAEKTTWEKIRALPFLDSRFIFFIFILLPVRTLFAHQFLTLPDYVIRCFPDYIGARYEWFQGLNPLIIVIFVPVIAAMTRKVNVLKMMIIGTTVSALTAFILVPGPNLYTLLTYVILFSFGEAIWSSRFLEYVADLAPAGQVGAYMGLAGIPWFLAKTTTGFYAGSMIEIFIPAWHPPMMQPDSSGTLWLIYAFIALISPIGLIIGKKWVEKGVPTVN